MKVLVTGGAGFIGFHVCKTLFEQGHDVVTIDNYNSYYDPKLKRARSAILRDMGVNITLGDLDNADLLNILVEKQNPDLIIHLAAYGGVRYSLEEPMLYIENNIVNTQNVIEAAVMAGVKKVVYASSSTVMTGNDLPWKESDPLQHQLSPYGYTKACNESQFITSDIENTIGLRFFTVYGPWGRPDMALFKFVDHILRDEHINLFGQGLMYRDYTYIDDIIQGVNIVIDKITSTETPINEIYNIGNSQPIMLADFVDIIEDKLGKKAKRLYLPKHPADPMNTFSNCTKLERLGYKPTTDVAKGVGLFVDWYKHYYGIN